MTVKSSPLVPVQPHGSRVPIFCPHAGLGEISFYYDLADRLGPDQPLYAFQPRGLYDASPPNVTMESMAADYVREMRGVQSQGPYQLLGWCLGAVIAFEMAQQLSANGEPVSELIALAGGPDMTIRPVAGPPEPHWTNRHARIFRREGFAAGVRGVRRKIGTKAMVRGWKGIFDVGELLLRFSLPIPARLRPVYSMLNHVRVSDNYRPRNYPGAIRVYVPAGLYVDPWLGWQSVVREVMVEEVPYVAKDVRGQFWPVVAEYFRTSKEARRRDAALQVYDDVFGEGVAVRDGGELIAAAPSDGRSPALESPAHRVASRRSPTRPGLEGRPRTPRGKDFSQQ